MYMQCATSPRTLGHPIWAYLHGRKRKAPAALFITNLLPLGALGVTWNLNLAALVPSPPPKCSTAQKCHMRSVIWFAGMVSLNDLCMRNASSENMENICSVRKYTTDTGATRQGSREDCEPACAGTCPASLRVGAS